MTEMSLQPMPERISITLHTGRGGDEANEGWFFLSPDEWDRFKVKLGNGTTTVRTVEPRRWHDIDVFSPDDFEAAIRDLRCQRYFGGCMMEPP